MSPKAPIETARLAAAEYLRQQGYVREADMVANGQGDDFGEVRMALGLLKLLQKPSAPPATRHGRRIAGEEC